MKSLDPRVNRLPKIGDTTSPIPALDQFGTFEVFVQPKSGKPFQHEGIVHAPNLEMAYVLAKEAFTRRFTCVSLYVVDTNQVYVSEMTDGDNHVYDQVDYLKQTIANPDASFEIYHLFKRGKQHVHAGTVKALTPQEAISTAKLQFSKADKIVFNVWIIPTVEIRFTKEEDKDLWETLPEKKFRDAADYKGGDRLKEFLERVNDNHE